MVVVGHSRGTWDEVSLREKDLRILSLTLPPRTRFLGRETPSETKPHSLPLYTSYEIEVEVVVVVVAVVVVVKAEVEVDVVIEVSGCIEVVELTKNSTIVPLDVAVEVVDEE